MQFSDVERQGTSDKHFSCIVKSFLGVGPSNTYDFFVRNPMGVLGVCIEAKNSYLEKKTSVSSFMQNM